MININLTNKQITIEAEGVRKITTPPIYQYDYGRKLSITGLVVSNLVEVHFCNKKSKKAVVRLGVQVGNAIEVPIPDELIEEKYEINAFVYEENDYQGKTKGHIIIPMIERAKPNDFIEVISPSEQAILQNAINQVKELIKSKLTDKVNDAIDECQKTLDEATQLYEDGITEEELYELISEEISSAVYPLKQITINLTKEGSYVVGTFTDEDINGDVFVEIFSLSGKVEVSGITRSGNTIKIYFPSGSTITSLKLAYYVWASDDLLQSFIYFHC